MSRMRVQLFNQIGKSVAVEADATVGAQMGVDLFDAAGNLLTMEAIADAVIAIIDAAPDGGTPPVERDELVKALAELQGAGLLAKKANGTWALRTLTGTADQVTVVNGNGEAGAPIVSLSDLADAGGGAFKLLVRDAKGRLSGTSSGDAGDVPTDQAAWTVISGATVQAALDSTDDQFVAVYVALAGKEPTIAAGTTAQWWRGDKTFTNTLTGEIIVDGVTLGEGFGSITGNLRVGNQALESGSLSGANNTAIGYRALRVCASGANNMAVGTNALNSLDSGVNNAAIGSSALAACVSGGSNTAVGINALASTTSFRNTAVGNLAGRGTDLTTINVSGNDNTYLGSTAGPGTTSQLSFLTCVGANSRGTTSNTVVLGRTTDTTVIGATGDSGSAALLQVTGSVDIGTGTLTLLSGANLTVVSGTTLLDGAVTVNDSGADRDFRVEGDTLSYLFFTDATAATENIACLTNSQPAWNSMDGGIFFGNGTTAPIANPTGGGYLYSEAGALKWRGTSGSVTTLAAA